MATATANRPETSTDVVLRLTTHLPHHLVFDPQLTDDELEAICASNDALAFERTREGLIQVHAPTAPVSSSANNSISAQLYAWWTTHRRGRTFDSSAGFFLTDGSMLSPDAAYASPERARAMSRDPKQVPRFGRFCPDFVIELLSGSDSLPAARSKMERWLENGALLGWLVDPFSKQVIVYEPGNPPRTESGDHVAGTGPVHGFVLDLGEVWTAYEE